MSPGFWIMLTVGALMILEAAVYLPPDFAWATGVAVLAAVAIAGTVDIQRRRP